MARERVSRRVRTQGIGWYDAWLRGEVLYDPSTLDDDDSCYEQFVQDGYPASRAQHVAVCIRRMLLATLLLDRDSVFCIDPRRPAAEQLHLFAACGWPTGPPSPLYMLRDMIRAAEHRYYLHEEQQQHTKSNHVTSELSCSLDDSIALEEMRVWDRADMDDDASETGDDGCADVAFACGR